MPVVVDTSVLVAYAHSGDPAHERAKTIMRRILRGEHGVPVANDYVLDEGLTVLQRRTGRLEDALLFASYLVPLEQADGAPILVFQHTAEDLVDRATDRFLDRFAKGLSFTDCVLIELAHHLDGVVATLEDGFGGEVGTITE